MFAKSMLLLASAALSFASPIQKGAESAPGCQVPIVPTLPLTGGAEELPAPAANLTLKYIALGLGIQNYTCASVGATPAATGAIAMFYDITKLYPGQSHSSLTLSKFNQLPAFALNHHKIPLNFNSSTAGRVDASSPGASLTHPFTRDAPLRLPGRLDLPFLGHHFFNAAGSPVFDLNHGALNVVAAKAASVSAPGSADPGPMGTGAVAWLALNAKDGSVGAKVVYRVETAGGNPHGCAKAAGQDSTSYAAAYWFFG